MIILDQIAAYVVNFPTLVYRLLLDVHQRVYEDKLTHPVYRNKNALLSYSFYHDEIGKCISLSWYIMVFGSKVVWDMATLTEV
jgi:hypothetical protein